MPSYYKELYSSRVMYTEGELHTYMALVDLPCLTDSTRERLDSLLTLKEIQLAVKSLKAGKTPGLDGFPAEFFKHYADDLLPKYRGMLLKALEESSLPPSMPEVVVVVLPKPDKDPKLCSSF